MAIELPKAYKAANRWKKAPGHVRVMAAEYVDPMIEALMDLDDKMSELVARISILESQAKK